MSLDYTLSPSTILCLYPHFLPDVASCYPLVLRYALSRCDQLIEGAQLTKYYIKKAIDLTDFNRASSQPRNLFEDLIRADKNMRIPFFFQHFFFFFFKTTLSINRKIRPVWSLNESHRYETKTKLYKNPLEYSWDIFDPTRKKNWKKNLYITS